jgi:hypothetical protein
MKKEADLTLEVIVLILFGVFYFLFGLLLFKIYAGELPYSPDSAFGLFLVLGSFQTITMGKTPFGDLRRSWALVILGMGTAVLGIATCFIPGYFTNFIRMLVGILLFAGGIVLLLQLCLSEKKARMWIKIPGILRQLTVACALVYVLTIVSGLITLSFSLRTNPRTAIILSVYGMSIFYLSWCIWKVFRTYGPEKPEDLLSSIQCPDRTDSQRRFILFQEASLPLLPAILIVLGILNTLLGLLLFPVGLGMLPFSPDGQLGLLLTVMALQMMTLGDTPVGQYTRSWFMVTIGIAFAGLGVVSCIVPGLLTGMIQILLGFLTVLGGAVFFTRRLLARKHEISPSPEIPIVVPPIIRKIGGIQLAMNSLGIVFGVSMLLPGLMPLPVVACILLIMGPLILVLASLLRKAEIMEVTG